MKKQEILDIIRNTRKVKNLTQQEMCEKLGVSRSQYSSLESGNSEITLDKFILICEILELNMSDFETKSTESVIKEKIKVELLGLLKKIKDL